MSSGFELVSEQFPLLRERVACLFESDHVFRELCEDYEACTLALSRQAASQDLSREYEALRLRLECELLRCLSEAPGPQGGRR